MWIDPTSILDRAATQEQRASPRLCALEVSEGPGQQERGAPCRAPPGYLLGDLTVWIGDLGCSLGQRAQLYTEAGVSSGLPFCQLFSVYS